MSTREKHHHVLDAEDSNDESEPGYRSDEELEKGGRSAKRRRLEDDEDDSSDDELDQEEREQSPVTVPSGKLKGETKAGDTNGDQEKTSGPKADANLLPIPKSNRPLKKNLVVTEKAIKKSGVVYISRIPPYMKPAKLRNLLEPFGKINRTFLAPEDPQVHARRVRNGGNKRKLFTEGWVEFVKKKDAKTVCELLNGQIIGGKKGNFYHDDIWNLRYLNNYKWHHLTEQIEREQAERASRMRAEISKTTRENKEFVRNVELGKQLEGMQTKAATKRKRTLDDGEAEEEEHLAAAPGPSVSHKKRVFKQTPLAKKDKRGETEDQPEQVKKVLSKIF